MNIIPPHDDRFSRKYQLMYNGNDYYVCMKDRNYGSTTYERSGIIVCYGWKITLLIKMFFCRLAQWWELRNDIKRGERQLKEHKVIIP